MSRDLETKRGKMHVAETRVSSSVSWPRQMARNLRNNLLAVGAIISFAGCPSQVNVTAAQVASQEASQQNGIATRRLKTSSVAALASRNINSQVAENTGVSRSDTQTTTATRNVETDEKFSESTNRQFECGMLRRTNAPIYIFTKDHLLEYLPPGPVDMVALHGKYPGKVLMEKTRSCWSEV